MDALTESPIVFESIESAEHHRCVDLFARRDGSFGFDEFRRDPEDGGAWTRVGYYSDRRYGTQDEAYRAAVQHVTWLEGVPPERRVKRY